MTFENAYNYLLSLANIPRKQYMKNSHACLEYMKRLTFLLNILDNPHKKVPHFAHVTGTSGKGSTTAFIANILQADGNKTASTQSPHPSIITERWKINGKQMSKKTFVRLIEKRIKPALETYIQTSPYEIPSFFEITEAIGFLWFAEENVDWQVLEVGCGGRYDATNIIPHKDIAVITNIGRDHIGVIGNNLAEIAYEKAGIIQKGCEVFTMEKRKNLRDIFKEELKRKKAKELHELHNIKYSILNIFLEETTFIYKENIYHIPTIGEHQIKNAILAIEVALSLNIPVKTIQKGLARTIQPLRMELISQSPPIIIDGAHNPDKIKTTVATLKKIAATNHNNIHLIIGFSAGKNITPMLKSLMTLKPKTVACTRFTNNPFRKVIHPNEIAKTCETLLPETKTHVTLDPQAALEWSKKQQKTDDIILVTGSVFLGGEIKQLAV